MRPSWRERFARDSRLHSALRRIARLALLLAVPLLPLGVAAYQLGFRFNLSTSIAPGVYRVTDGPIHRGVIVLVCLPNAVAALAREREYISAGSCADGNAPIGKRVAATPGDTVDVTSAGIAVNGRLMPNTQPLARDRNGRALPGLARGRYVVSVGEVWLVSTFSARSFDSRYFGPLSSTHIVDRIRPVLTLR